MNPEPQTIAPHAPIAPSKERRLDISGSDRVFLTGKTGSGKTYLAMHLLADQKRVVVVDLKGSDTIGAWDYDAPGRDTMRALQTGRGVRVRLRTNDQALEYMSAAFDAGLCVVYIDEVYLLIPQGTKAPQVVTDIWTMGRERGIGGWAATQRPVWVPVTLISEAEWTFLFRLKTEDDRKRVAPYMGEEVLAPITDEHGFFVSKDSWDRPLYSSGISLPPPVTAAATPPSGKV